MENGTHVSAGRTRIEYLVPLSTARGPVYEHASLPRVQIDRQMDRARHVDRQVESQLGLEANLYCRRRRLRSSIVSPLRPHLLTFVFHPGAALLMPLDSAGVLYALSSLSACVNLLPPSGRPLHMKVKSSTVDPLFPGSICLCRFPSPVAFPVLPTVSSGEENFRVESPFSQYEE